MKCEIGKYYRNLDDNYTFKFDGGYPTFKDNYDIDVKCELEEWKPKANEVCWFYNTYHYRPKIGKFKETYIDDITKSNVYVDDEAMGWNKCVPFTTDIPEFFIAMNI